MFWLKLAGKVIELAGMGALLLATRWLLTPRNYKDDVREAKHLVHLLRWDMFSLSNWVDMLPYRFAVVASHELGIAQRNLRKLRARYERGEFASDSTAEQQPDSKDHGGSDTNGLAGT